MLDKEIILTLRKCTTLLPLLALMAACSSSTDANKKNFAEAIDKDLDKRCVRVDFEMNSAARGRQFPVSVETAQKTTSMSAAQAEASNQRHLRQFEAMVGAGLLTREDGEVSARYGKGQVSAKIYSLTDAGAKSLLRADYTTFCAGTYEVIEVVSFTAPGPSLDGQTLSTAKFTFRPRNVPDWAKSDVVQAAFPGLARALADSQDGKASLVLQNDGWSASRSTF